MEKIKRAAAIMLAAAIAMPSMSVFAAGEKRYYEGFEFPRVKYEEMQIDESCVRSFDEIYKNTLSEIENKDKMAIISLLAMQVLMTRAESSYALLMIEAAKHNTEENNAKAREYYDKIVAMYEKQNELIKLAYETPELKTAVTEFLGGEEAAQEFFTSFPDKAVYALINEESAILEEHNNHPFGEYVLTDANGNSYNFEQLNAEIEKSGMDYSSQESFMESLEKHWGLVALFVRYFNESGKRTGEQFDRIVDIRDRIAKAQGYESYGDYAYEMVNTRDYSLADSRKFREAVKEYIVPLFKAVKDSEIKSAATTAKAAAISDEELTEKIGKAIEQISPEMKEAYDYMFEYNLIDREPSEEKAAKGTAFTTLISEYRTPYVFISAADKDSYMSISSLLHEFGHFNAQIHGSATASEDVSEINSQGLELLATESYEELFGRDAAALRYALVYDMLDSICSGCLFDEWQEEVYKHPEMSVEEMDALFTKLSEDYGKGTNGLSYTWAQVPHNFESPMYYISYAVSAAAALELWEMSLTDKESAKEKYMQLTVADAPEGETENFRDALKRAGLADVFDESSVQTVAATVEDYFTCGYADVKLGDWYADAVYMTSEYIEPLTSTEFAPNTAADRLTAVQALGKVCEANGEDTDGYKAGFADTNNNKYAAWAYETGVIKGYDDTTFGANDSLTREQAVTMIYRHAANIGADVSAEDIGAKFEDLAEVSDWAAAAVEWAVSAGVIKGTDERKIMPKRAVTRAELAQMMLNLDKSIRVFNEES